MKAELWVVVETGYMQTGFKRLAELSVLREWNKGRKVNVWVFPMSRMKEVIGVLGELVELNEDEVREATRLCPPLKESLRVKAWKGDGEITIQDTADGYIITEMQKEETPSGFEVKEVSHTIPRENVDVMWRVMLTYPLRERVKGLRDVARNICGELGVTRFNRPVGSWDKDKFFGCRSEYKRYYYFPAKVLHHKHKIVHHKNGDIERIADEC